MQAPHSPVSQPCFTPWKPSARSTSSSVVRASAGARRRSPFTHSSTIPEVKYGSSVGRRRGKGGRGRGGAGLGAPRACAIARSRARRVSTRAASLR